MGKKAEYRSAIRSRRLIRQAFLELLEEKPFSKITVTAIVARADLNRATFYAHYPDVRGVVEEIENELSEKLLEVLGKFHFTDFFNNPMPLLMEASRYVDENQDLLRTLLKNVGSDTAVANLKSTFAEYILNKSDTPEELLDSTAVQLRIYYFANGMIGLYQQWLLDTLNCTLEDIAREVSHLLHLEATELYAHRTT